MIRLEEKPEPLTEASWSKPPVLAESETLRTLVREIQRYANRETSGRSFLIAGHRGAGKTTSVRFAVQRAQTLAREGKLKLWPLLISLHGPDILDAENADRPRVTPAIPATSKIPSTLTDEKLKIAPEAPANANENKEKATSVSPSEASAAALRILAKSLHRALADELANSFRRHIENRITVSTGRGDLLELAAHVEQALDHAADLASLREYWHHAGAFESGVLAAGRETWGKSLTPGQGARELIAISTAIEAFQIVAGKANRSDQTQFEGKHEKTSIRGINLGGKDLLNPLVGAVTGGAIGLGTLQSNSSPWLASVLGVGSAIATTLTLNYSASKAQRTEQKRVNEFTWDTSIASLDRMLPVLIERMLKAGIAPIFVIDELDKVAELSRVMEDLITHLKHFVTERAFFCFLCDRTYFEQIVASGRTGHYGREYTFFSDRLFLQYTPTDLRKYLEGILISSEPKNPDERKDLNFLIYILLQTSRLSPIGLRRELNRYIDGRGEFSLAKAEIRGRQGYQMRAFMQLAVEEVFGEGSDKTEERPLRKRMRQDWLFARLAVDALYYPATEWARGKLELDISKEGFKKYVEDKLNGDNEPENNKGLNGVASRNDPGEPVDAKPRLSIPGVDFELLYEIFKELLDHLNTPSSFFDPDPPVEGFEIRLVPGFFHPESKAGMRSWRYDPFGKEIAIQEPIAQTASSSVVLEKLGTPEDVSSMGRAPAPTATPMLREDGIKTSTSTQPAAEDDKPNATSTLVSAAPGSASVPTGATPSPPASTTPAINLQDRLDSAENDADWIEEIQGLLEPFGQAFTLASLAQEHHILELSPDWTNTAAAIRRVVAPRARAHDLAEEMQTIKAYAKMVRENGDRMRNAFLLALACSSHNSNGPHPAKIDGLSLVVRLFGLEKVPHSKSTENLGNVLEKLWLALSPRAIPNLSEIQQIDPSDVIAWLTKLSHLASQHLRERLTNWPSRVEFNPSELAEKWTTFLRSTSFGFESVYQPGFVDFNGAARSFNFLPAFVDDLTLREVSNLRRLFPSGELTKAVMAFLGVGPRLKARQQRVGARVLFIMNSNRSDTASLLWKPSAKHAILPVDSYDDFHNVLSSVFPDGPDISYYDRWRPDVILIEPCSVNEFTLLHQRIQSAWQPEIPMHQVEPALKLAAPPTSGNDFLPIPSKIVADSVDEAVDQANRMKEHPEAPRP